MKKVSLIFILSMAIAAFANAQATRTWVSGVGDDVNPCSRTAPCKTFAGAISKTASPGIINCLDPGGFGAVTITKSITLDCTGTLGSILSSGVQGIVINALTTDKVVLRNLDINGAGVTLGTNGVNVIQAGSVIVDHVNIANYSAHGIEATNSSNAINLFVFNSTIQNVGNVGIFASNTGTGTVKVFVDHTSVVNAGNVGVDLGGANDVAFISNSFVSRNTNAGVQVENGSSSANIESTTLSANGTGVVAGVAGATVVRLSRCIITGNTVNGVSGSGTTRCFSNNVIEGNTGTNACSVPAIAQQ
jgi:hypothetical protein